MIRFKFYIPSLTILYFVPFSVGILSEARNVYLPLVNNVNFYHNVKVLSDMFMIHRVLTLGSHDEHIGWPKVILIFEGTTVTLVICW